MARTASGKAKADGTKGQGAPKKRTMSKAAPDGGSSKSASMVKNSPNAKVCKAKGSEGQAPMDSAMAPKVLLAKMTLSRALNAKIGSFNAMHHSMDQKPRKLEVTCPMALDAAATLLEPFEGPYSNTSSGKTGYMLFKEETTAAAKASNKHAKGPSFSECGELWRNLSSDEKEVYKQRAGSAEGSSRSNSIGIGDTAAAAPGSSTSKKKPAGAAGGIKANGSGGDVADGLVPVYPKAVAEFLNAEKRAQLADSLVVKTAAVGGASASSSSSTSVPSATLELYGQDPERALRVSRKCLARYAFQLGLSPSLGLPPPSPLAAAAVAKAFPANKNISSSNTSNTSNGSSSISSSSSSRANSRCSSRNIRGSSNSSSSRSSNPSATLVANALSYAVREAEELRHLCLALPARLKEPPQWRTGIQGGAALETLLGKHLFAAERICQGALTSYGSVKVAVVVRGSVEFTHDHAEGALKVTFATEFQRRN